MSILANSAAFNVCLQNITRQCILQNIQLRLGNKRNFWKQTIFFVEKGVVQKKTGWSTNEMDRSEKWKMLAFKNERFKIVLTNANFWNKTIVFFTEQTIFSKIFLKTILFYWTNNFLNDRLVRKQTK